MKQLFSGTTTLRLALFFLMGLATLGQGLRVSGVLVPSAVVSGSTVRLMCSFELRKDQPDPLYSVKWYRGVEQFYEYITGNDPPIRVYPLPHLNVDKQQSDRNTVVLKGVTKDSSGTFRCEVLGDKPYFETDDHAENMTVFEVPEWGPEIKKEVQGTIDNRVRPGDLVNAQCIVGASDPSVNFQWLVNGQPAPQSAIINIPTQINEAERPHQSSELEIVVTEDSFQRGAMTVTCEAGLPGIYKRSAYFTLIHADHPQPAEFGWFSSGSRLWFSFVIVEATVSALCLLLIC